MAEKLPSKIERKKCHTDLDHGMEDKRDAQVTTEQCLALCFWGEIKTRKFSHGNIKTENYTETFDI